ncbi:hypothetical protein [Amycolatopsis arida]|uniref:hypothetical protein n=1 Tax=Amycolatopsis arida TaxID=587909 RepID=UPI000B81EC11|nr:hypothetical protein [Amycolatopsis arida]
MLAVAASVELFGGFQEREGGSDEPSAVGEVGAGGVEPLGEVSSFAFDVAEPGFDLGLRQRVVGGEVDQVLLEFTQLGGDLLVQEARGGFLFADDGVDMRTDIRDELWAEPDAGVVPLDCLFDLVHVDV